MTSFQKTITRENLATGVVGDLAFDGPTRASALALESANEDHNVIGRYFTVESQGRARAGGNGPIAGILFHPKRYAAETLFNNDSGQLTLKNGSVGEFLSMGKVFVQTTSQADIGDLVTYNVTNGQLGIVPASFDVTASQATSVLTVTAVTGGSLKVGSVVTLATGVPVTIVSLGTGTGGTGTYNVDVEQTVASADGTATSVPDAGFAFVPNARVTDFDVEDSGIAVVTLTN